MFRLILKTLWARRKRNAWLLAELILVCILSWAIFDPLLVLTHDRRLPLGFDPERLCLLSVDMLHPQAPGYALPQPTLPGGSMPSSTWCSASASTPMWSRARRCMLTRSPARKATPPVAIPPRAIQWIGMCVSLTICPTRSSSRPTASKPVKVLRPKNCPMSPASSWC